MNAHRPSARSSCKPRKVAKTAAREVPESKPSDKPQHQPFMLGEEFEWQNIGKPVACPKAAIRIARKKKGGKSDITVGVVSGNEVIFAEGPKKDRLLNGF